MFFENLQSFKYQLIQPSSWLLRLHEASLPFLPTAPSSFLALVSVTNLLTSILDFFNTLTFLTRTVDNGKILLPFSSSLVDKLSLIALEAKSEIVLLAATLARYLVKTFLMARIWE